MKNFGKLLYRRYVLIAVAILMQLGFTLLLVSHVISDFHYVELWMRILAWAFVVYIISGSTDPSYKIAWIIPLLAAPIFGLTFYILFGGNRLSKRLRRKMNMVEQLCVNNLSQNPETARRERLCSVDAAIQSEYLCRFANSPVYEGVKTTYFPSGELSFQPMLDAIDGAETYIFLEYFIIEKGLFWDTILAKLEKKAAAGLDVRIIYDDFGCIKTLPAGYAKRMEAVGIRVAVFNPFVPILSARLNNRDHRKFLIVDGKIGFTGGINLADEYINHVSRFGYWKDCTIRLEGEAVWSMTVMFASMWAYVCGEKENISRLKPEYFPENAEPNGFVQPFCDSPLDNEFVGETVYFNMITKAKQSVFIMTPYLIISDKMASCLCSAAKSGIDVRIITPGIPDKPTVYAVTRANYATLVRGGVKIYEFCPGFIHGKVFAVDGNTAVVGSVNFDFRSLYLHFEDGVWVHGADCVADIMADFYDTFPQCHQVTLVEVLTTRWIHQAWRNILRVFAPLM